MNLSESKLDALIAKRVEIALNKRESKRKNQNLGGVRLDSGRPKGVKNNAQVWGKITTIRCPEVLSEEIRQHINNWKQQRLTEYYQSLEKQN